MSETGLSVGQTLRAAREAQGLGVEEVAGRLRLMLRQVEAIESDDFGSLGQPVFARGFVRNYAKLLDLPHAALLARMGGDSAETAVMTQAPSPPARSWLSSPWLILGLLGLLALFAAPVGLYLWLNSDGDEEAVPAMSASPAVKDDAAGPAAVVAPQPAAAPAPATEPAKRPAETAPPERAAAQPSPTDSSSPTGVLYFEFGGEAWVEIRDGSGRMVHRQLNTPGSQVEISGQPPFDLIVGNAEQVRMTYNGRPIDLKPYIEVTVARFSLEE